VLLRLGLKLAQLPGEALLPRAPLLPCALELLVTDHCSQGDIEQAGVLPLQLGERLMQGPLPRLQRLREPCAPLGTRPCLGDEGWLRQHLTAGLPDACIEGLGPAIPSHAARPQGCPQGVGPASTTIRALAGWACAPRTGSRTLATADQAPQEGLMGRGVPARPMAILDQTCLCRLTRLLAAEGRDWEGQPVLRRRGPMAQAWANRPQRRLPGPGRHGAPLATMGDAGRDWIAEQAAHARGVPARCAHRGGPRHITASFRSAIEGMRGRRIRVPGKDVDDDGRFDGSKPQALRVAGTCRGKQRAIGGHRPGSQLPTPHCGLAASSHAVGDQGARICRHSATDVEPQVLMRIMTHRALQALDGTALLGQCLPEQHLMDVVAGESIRCRDEDPFEGPHGRPVTSLISARSVELGSTGASIAGDMRLGQMPVGLHGSTLPQTGALVRNRLLRLVPVGGDSGIESPFHHGVPPLWCLWASPGARPRRPTPSVGAAGTPGPTADCHRVG
jgi:hypothetical protein